MTVDRTELEWTYEPTDFFEATHRQASPDFDLVIESGKATANLTVPTDPLPPDLEARIQSFVQNVFLVRQLQVHRNYKLEGPTVSQHSSGRKNVSLRIACCLHALTSSSVDFIVQDAAGNVIRDSKAERIGEHTTLLNQLASKLQLSASLRTLFDSYSRAVADPDDELVHLYEIRDALSNHYGGEQLARNALGISKSEWQRLGFLANAEPLEQSRHRGKHSQGRRPATDEELNEARRLVRQWIIAFARAV